MVSFFLCMKSVYVHWWLEYIIILFALAYKLTAEDARELRSPKEYLKSFSYPYMASTLGAFPCLVFCNPQGLYEASFLTKSRHPLHTFGAVCKALRLGTRP